MSVYLKYGLIHPRTMLARPRGPAVGVGGDLPHGARVARVLRRHPVPAPRLGPDELRQGVRRAARRVRCGTPVRRSTAWREGRTGFPIVDAGMRQLREQAWMHNRVRMIVASFLVKDLHLPWWWGARHFMSLLVDGDLASNQHGWQWTAGSGTDASPYFRVFNPTTQGEKFDPDGDYVRRFVPGAARRAGEEGAPAVGAARRSPRGLPGADRRPPGGAAGGPRPLRAGEGRATLSHAGARVSRSARTGPRGYRELGNGSSSLPPPMEESTMDAEPKPRRRRRWMLLVPLVGGVAWYVRSRREPPLRTSGGRPSGPCPPGRRCSP